MAPSNRQGGGGLSLRTLTIASLASLTAAIVTREFFPPGTVYASALTPVVVAAVSELLNRPVDRVSTLREQRRTMVLEAARSERSNPLRGAPDFAVGAEGIDEEPPSNGHRRGRDPLEGVTLHARSARRGILHPKLWIATGLVAFVIGAAVLTLPELIFGGAVATKHRTTLFGGGGSGSSAKDEKQTTTTKQEATQTETVPAAEPPAQSTPTETSTDTQTTPTSTETGTSTTTTSTSTGTGTSTVPLPAQP
jgi:hypothetical protein